MAYYELGKFTEAEQWLNRAKSADKTLTASEYNLGRIAYETGRYKEAAALFEKVLVKDPSNVMALKAAAYTRIKTGELEAAEKLYQRVLKLVGDSADDGYNYALVLYALKKYEAAEEHIGNNQYALLENKDMLLLYARTQKAQNKVEAADSYAKWLVNNSDPRVRYEYAQVLEGAELYARALEEYRTSLTGLSPSSTDPSRAEIRYTIARLLFTADPENPEGITELRAAVTDGYSDIDAIEKLALDEKISAGRRDEIRTIIDEAKRSIAEREAQRLAAEAAAIEGDELILHLLPEDAFLSEAPVRTSIGSSAESSLSLASRAPLVYRNYLENSVVSTSNLMTIDWGAAAVVSGKDGPYAVKDEKLSAQVLAAEFVLEEEKNWTGFEVRLGNKRSVLERAETMEVPFKFYEFTDAAPSFTLILQFGVFSDKEKDFVENSALLVEKQLYPPVNAVDPNNPTAFSAASRIGTIEFDAAERRKLRDATHMRLLVKNNQGGRQLAGRVLLGTPVVVKK
jgi:tetratricopeptide (TPR) repeat protein